MPMINILVLSVSEKGSFLKRRTGELAEDDLDRLPHGEPSFLERKKRHPEKRVQMSQLSERDENWRSFRFVSTERF